MVVLKRAVNMATGSFLAITLLAAGAPVAANTTLIYTGVPFAHSSPATGSGISGYVIVRSFDAAIEQEFTARDLVDWSISTGAFTLSKAGGNVLDRFGMLTFVGGRFRSWAFDAQDAPIWTKFARTDNAYFDISEIKDNSYSGVSQNVGDSGGWRVAASVPEPAAWGMMLVGFGIVGAVVRARRTAAVSLD